METVFYLTRHGQTEWNSKLIFQGQLNSPLTPLGIKQAEALRPVIKKINPDVIISSPLGRALETCEIATERDRSEIILANEMKEIDFGILSGRTMEQLKEEFPGVHEKFHEHDENYVIPEGESARQLAERVFSYLDNTAEQHPGKKIFISTHGCVLAAILNQLNNRSLLPFNGHSIKNSECIKIIKNKVYTICNA